jgi:hypothetical protein
MNKNKLNMIEKMNLEIIELRKNLNEKVNECITFEK